MSSMSKKLIFEPLFGQDGKALEGDSVLIGASAYNLEGAAKTLVRSDESGRHEVVGPLLIGQKAVLAAATILPGAGLGASRTSGIATITTSAVHGFVVGDVVVVSGVTLVTDPFDGTYVIESIPTTTSFTYHNAGVDEVSESGTAYNQTRNPRPLFIAGTDPAGNIKNVAVDANGNLIVAVSSGSGTQYQDGTGWSAGAWGTGAWAVRKDAAGPLSGVADNEWSPLQVDANGQLKVVADIIVAQDFVYAEDTAHGDGNLGAYVLSVRQDALSTLTSLTGDYDSFKVNARGALWTAPVGTVADDVADTENPVKVGSRVRQVLAAVALNGNRADLISDMYRRLYVMDAPNRTVLSTPVTVGLAAVALPSTPLAGRTRMFIQNKSVKAIFVGDSTVTTVKGIEISAGGDITLEVGDQVLLYAIAGTAALDVRVMEIA